MSRDYDDFDRALLRAGRRAQAPSRLRRTALAAAAAGGTALVASQVVGKAAAASGGAAAAAGTTLGKGAAIASATALKWGIAMAVAIGAASASVYAVRRHVDAPPAISPRPSTSQVASAEPAPPSRTRDDVPPVPSASPLETPPVVTGSPPRSESAPPSHLPAERRDAPREPTEAATPSPARAEGNAAASAAGARATLADEIGLVDSARRALARGDSAAALRLVDDHAARYPVGAFVVERDALRVDALVLSGREADARAAAQKFLREHGNTPQSGRISKIAGEGANR